MENLGGVLSMSQELDIYVISGLTIVIGISCRQISTSQQRKIIGSILGLLSMLLFCGKRSVFPLTTIAMTLIWKLFSVKIQPKLSIIVFALIILTRVMFGLSDEIFRFKTNDFTVTNTIHMFISLRCVSAMFEICASRSEIKLEDNKQKPSSLAPYPIPEEPSLFDLFGYLTYAPAISLGPFYTYKTYYDSVTRNNVEHLSIPWKKYLMEKFRKAVVLFILLKIKHMLFDSNMFTTDVGLSNFENGSYFYKMSYMFARCLEMSTFLSLMWQLGECTCISFGVGAYQQEARPGQGPVASTTDKNDNKLKSRNVEEFSLKNENDWNFETIANGSGELWLFEQTMSDLFRNWNRTTQWWLARYCYTLPCIKHKHKALRMAFTQFINVYWHGISPGYLISLMEIPLLIMSENFYFLITNNLSSSKILKYCDKVIRIVVFNVILMTYTSLPFILGDFTVIKLTYISTFQYSFVIICFSFSLLFVIAIVAHLASYYTKYLNKTKLS